MGEFNKNQRLITLRCNQCGHLFRYKRGKSNNFRKFCDSCSSMKILDSKRRFEERRNIKVSVFRSVSLNDIPDRYRNPENIIEEYKRKAL